MTESITVSIKGKAVEVPAVTAAGARLIVTGRWLRVGEIFDEYWVERDSLPSPEDVVRDLGTNAHRPDLFTYAQRVPDETPAHQHHQEWDNYAVLPLTTYEHWLAHQIPSATRRNIRASEKRGVTVRVAEFDDAYVRGIKDIYDETPVRAGRKFWHYGKDIQAVRLENGTYAARSTFLAADVNGEMAGYLKVVWDRETAAIMQILSKTAVRDLRPNNAMLAETVRQCCMRGIRYLIYEKFDYGQKTGDSLTKFKENHGFARMNIPRYYVPLTARGAAALRLGLHKGWKERLPESVAGPIRDLRSRLHQRVYAGRRRGLGEAS